MNCETGTILSSETGREATLTERLIKTAENLNEIRDVIAQIGRKFKGPEPQKEACEKAQWPPQYGIEEWAMSNYQKTDDILNKMYSILQIL